MKQSNDLISEELSQAGESSGLSPLLSLMLKREITPDMELPPMDFLMRLFGESCFPRRELVAFSGRAKSGKTFVMSIIMLMCLINRVMQFERDGDEPLKVLWFDTEQSQQSTLDIIQNRIMAMYRREKGDGVPFPKANLRTFNVRFDNCETRRRAFMELVPYVKPDLVILDGIRDLVPDINDGAEAQRIMEEMLGLAQMNDCCILAVLHQNKTGDSRDPRGWLGTELLNKAFDVFATEKLKIQSAQDTRYVFKLEQLYTRKYDIDQQLWFEVDDNGLPFETEAPPMPVYMSAYNSMTSAAEAGMEDRPMLNGDYMIYHPDGSWEMNVPKLFTDAFECHDSLKGAALRFKVKTLANIATNRLYNNCLDKAMAMNLMHKEKDPSGCVVYTLNVQKQQKPVPPQQPSLFNDESDIPIY